MRSVYRLLNSNLFPELRRGDGIDVESSGPREATPSISGLSDEDETVTISLYLAVKYRLP